MDKFLLYLCPRLHLADPHLYPAQRVLPLLPITHPTLVFYHKS